MASPRIVVTTPSFSANPQLREELESRFPGVRFNDAGERLKGEALVRFCEGAEGAVIGLEAVDEAFLAACPSLRIVAKYGVGLDNIDIAACEDRGVAVGWTGGVNRRAVAELTLAFLLGLCRNVFSTGLLLKGGAWRKNGGRQLSQMTVGIVGLGNVGMDLVGLLRPFGCRILANDIADRSAFCAEFGVESVDKPTLWRESDAVTLHVPLTPDTRHLVDARVLAAMRPSAFLINTARGEVVDQAALAAALQDGIIAGAALDVFAEEPPTDPDFLGLPNLFATPHIGGNAVEAVLAMGRSAISHLSAFFDKEVGR